MTELSTPTMLERIGGEPKLRALCERFHALVLDDPLLNAMFAYSGDSHVDHLTTFLVEMFGGPARYSSELNGIDGLYDAHLELGIEEEQRQRFVQLLLQAADETGMPSDEAFRSQFARHIEAGSRFSMKFSQPGLAAAPRPTFPEIDPWTW